MRSDELIERLLDEDDNTDGGQSVRHTFGKEKSERGNCVAASPSHAPTSTAEFHTETGVKSDDQGEPVGKGSMKGGKSGGAGDANSTQVAKSPSHAPTGTAEFRTKNSGSSDEGEGESKKAMKENKDEEIEGLADQYLSAPPNE